MVWIGTLYVIVCNTDKDLVHVFLAVARVADVDLDQSPDQARYLYLHEDITVVHI